MRLDVLLVGKHPELSRRKARAAIEKGQVTVDGERVREPGRDVPAAAGVSLDRNRPALSRVRCSLPILYQDEHLLVVDKPAGLLAVPSGPASLEEDTALGRVQDYARRLRPRAGFAERVHRLDRDTSGALAFALTPEARVGLVRTFRDHRIERTYLVLVLGVPRGEGGEVRAPLREAWRSGRKAVARPGEPAQAALTRFRVRERLAAGVALLEVQIETGRQHQIRVHLAHVGLPVLGDPVYGSGALRVGRLRPMRPMLHASRLGFRHPISGVRVCVESPLPQDMKRALAALGTTSPTRPRG